MKYIGYSFIVAVATGVLLFAVDVITWPILARVVAATIAVFFVVAVGIAAFTKPKMNPAPAHLFFAIASESIPAGAIVVLDTTTSTVKPHSLGSSDPSKEAGIQ